MKVDNKCLIKQREHFLLKQIRWEISVVVNSACIVIITYNYRPTGFKYFLWIQLSRNCQSSYNINTSASSPQREQHPPPPFFNLVPKAHLAIHLMLCPQPSFALTYLWNKMVICLCFSMVTSSIDLYCLISTPVHCFTTHHWSTGENKVVFHRNC